MAIIEFFEGAIEVDAKLMAEGLSNDLPSVQAWMREGKITSRYERGMDGGEGVASLTIFTEHRRLRLIVDERGRIFQRSTIDFSGKLFSASVRDQVTSSHRNLHS